MMTRDVWKCVLVDGGALYVPAMIGTIQMPGWSADSLATKTLKVYILQHIDIWSYIHMCITQLLLNKAIV